MAFADVLAGIAKASQQHERNLLEMASEERRENAGFFAKMAENPNLRPEQQEWFIKGAMAWHTDPKAAKRDFNLKDGKVYIPAELMAPPEPPKPMQMRSTGQSMNGPLRALPQQAPSPPQAEAYTPPEGGIPLPPQIAGIPGLSMEPTPPTGNVMLSRVTGGEGTSGIVPPAPPPELRSVTKPMSPQERARPAIAAMQQKERDDVRNALELAEGKARIEEQAAIESGPRRIEEDRLKQAADTVSRVEIETAKASSAAQESLAKLREAQAALATAKAESEGKLADARIKKLEAEVTSLGSKAKDAINDQIADGLKRGVKLVFDEATGKLTGEEPIPLDELPVASQSKIAQIRSLEKLNLARAEMERAKNDPNSPAYKLAQQKAQRAASRLGMTPRQEFSSIEALTKQWTKASEDIREINKAAAIMDAGLEAARRGDMNMGAQAVLVTFQKFLDPDSVVRESEYARSPSGLSMEDRIEGWFEKNFTTGGAGVPLAELEKFAALAKEIQSKLSPEGPTLLKAEKERIGRTADHFSLSRDLIFADYPFSSTPKSPSPSAPTPPAKGGTAPAANGLKNLSTDDLFKALMK